MTIVCAHCLNTIEAADVLAYDYSCPHCGHGHSQDVITVSTQASCNNYEIERTDSETAPYMVVIGNDGGTTFATLQAAFDYVFFTDYPLALAARFEEYAAGLDVTIDLDTLDADTVLAHADGIDDSNRPVTITARIVPPEDTADGLGFTGHTISTDYDADGSAFLAALDGAQKDLAAAVIEQMGGFETFATDAPSIAAHGAMGGWSGFTYYSDTVPFTVRHLRTLREYGREMADSIGADGFYSLVAGFNCLDLTTDEVADALHDADHDSHTGVMNALAWFALEEAARMYDDRQDSGRP